MSDQPRGVFVFDRDMHVSFFQSLDEAAEGLEAIDVDDGEYEIFAFDGRTVTPTSHDGVVKLRLTEGHDDSGLRSRLQQCQQLGRFAGAVDDPEAIANELLAMEWAARWPRWPMWLDRRLHGERPPGILRVE